MLDLLAGIVQQDGLELLVLGVVGALAVPVDGLQLFLQRSDGVVHMQRVARQFLVRDMDAFARHGRNSLSWRGGRRGGRHGALLAPSGKGI